MICETQHKSLEDALIEFYNSKVYHDLEIEETKMWHEGATYIYESFLEEGKDKF